MLLTIDAGNTRTKWAIFDHDGTMRNYGACLNAQLSTADLSPKSLGYEQVIISNVAGSGHAAQLKSILAPYLLPVHWMQPSERACDVINHYKAQHTLGSDRWAALIAAWQMQHAPCVVVNAGTAVTIDALSMQARNKQHGEFLGGMILPGIYLMQTSLGGGTAQLPPHVTPLETDAEVNIFARSTAQAIHSGTLCAIGGAIVQMAKALEAKSGQIPNIILSGGDAPVIQRYLIHTANNPTIVIDHLVLTGLYLIARSEQ